MVEPTEGYLLGVASESSDMTDLREKIADIIRQGTSSIGPAGALARADAILALFDSTIKDAEIGRLVRRKLVSRNNVPVDRCTIKAEEVAAIDAAKEEG